MHRVYYNTKLTQPCGLRPHLGLHPPSLSACVSTQWTLHNPILSSVLESPDLDSATSVDYLMSWRFGSSFRSVNAAPDIDSCSKSMVTPDGGERIKFRWSFDSSKIFPRRPSSSRYPIHGTVPVFASASSETRNNRNNYSTVILKMWNISTGRSGRL